jgi:hypothetical protein
MSLLRNLPCTPAQVIALRAALAAVYDAKAIMDSVGRRTVA